MSTWFLAIDFGTTNTCAAIVTVHGSRSVGFGPSHLARMPSGVLARADGGLLLGFEAQRQAPLHPDRYDPAPKRSVGQAMLLLGEREIPVVEAVAAVLAAAAGEARKQQGGTPPAQTCLTYPARWGTTRQSVLRDAATRAGLGDVVLVSEPEAAAAYFAKHDGVPVGRSIAVYDLGGGTFDVAVLTATPDGFRLIGSQGGFDPFGGENIDERLLNLTLDRVGQLAGAPGAGAMPTPGGSTAGDRQSRLALAQEVRRAKEDLATSESTELVLPDRGSTATLSRADLRAAAGDDVDATVTEFLRTVATAGTSCEQLAGVYLAGGSSKLPLVRESLSRRLPPGTHRMVRTLNDPKAAVALGAAELLYDCESKPAAMVNGLLPATRPRRPMTWRHFLAGAVVLAMVALAGGVWLRQRDTNAITGTVRDSRGEPLADVEILLTSGMSEAGGKHVKVKTDGNGHYTTKLPRGDYQLDAYATLGYEGREVQVHLSPREYGSDSVTLPTSGGAKLDLDLKMSGQMPQTIGGSYDDYFGGSVVVTEWFDIDGAAQPLYVIRNDLEVTFHFVPVGPLLDGSEGKSFDVTRTVGELVSGTDALDHDAVLYDIPLGSYALTATLTGPSGEEYPLVMQDPSTTASSPVESVTIPLLLLCEVGCGDSSLSVRVPVGIANG